MLMCRLASRRPYLANWLNSKYTVNPYLLGTRCRLPSFDRLAPAVRQPGRPATTRIDSAKRRGTISAGHAPGQLSTCCLFGWAAALRQFSGLATLCDEYSCAVSDFPPAWTRLILRSRRAVTLANDFGLLKQAFGNSQQLASVQAGHWHRWEYRPPLRLPDKIAPPNFLKISQDGL